MKDLSSEEIILSGLSGNTAPNIKAGNVSKLGASQFRMQMIERIPNLPAKLQKDLKEDRAQISDKDFFVIRELTGTSTDIIRKNEKSEAGLRNIDDAELGENQHFLLLAISLQYRSGNSGRFDELFPDFLANAVYTVKLGTREIMTKNSVDKFQSPAFGYNIFQPLGLLILDNPKLIEPKKTIAFNIEDAPSAMSGSVKLKLIGIEVKNY